MRPAPQEMCKASYECAEAGPLAWRVLLVMTQMAALFALAPAPVAVSQDDNRGELKDASESKNGTSHEADKRRE